MLVFACISPHPPIILPAVGSPADRAQVKKTIESLEKLGNELAKAKPECILISSPHPDWGFDVPAYFLLAQMKNAEWKMENYQEANSIFSIINSQFAIYPLLTTLDSPKKHFKWGQKIIQAIPDKLRVVWIASGDMSHRLKEDGPYGLHPSGPKFDQEFIRLLKKKNIQGILNLDPNLVEEAGECGLRSFCMLLGALEASKINWQPEILSYEAPFGVGYLVANFNINHGSIRKTR